MRMTVGMLGALSLLGGCGGDTSRTAADGEDTGADGGRDDDGAGPGDASTDGAGGGAEVCDGVDNDLDGLTDEGCAPVPGCSWAGLAGSANPGGVSNTGNAGPPSVAVDSQGAIYLAWAAGPPGNSQIHVFRYDDVAACGATTWQRVGAGAVSSGAGDHA